MLQNSLFKLYFGDAHDPVAAIREADRAVAADVLRLAEQQFLAVVDPADRFHLAVQIGQ